MESVNTTGTYALNKDELALLQEDFLALFCDDTQCLQSIAQGFKKGFVLDPHSAIAYYGAKKLQEEGAITKTIFLSTAEWSKFAPSVWEALAKAHIVQGICKNDKEALEGICGHTQVSIPPQIGILFDKEEVQNDVISPTEIESCIMQWLRDKN